MHGLLGNELLSDRDTSQSVRERVSPYSQGLPQALHTAQIGRVPQVLHTAQNRRAGSVM
jgi:hypothetical protein